MLKILQGQTNKESRTVGISELEEVSAAALDMKELCNKPCGRYPSAYAIAHCQVEHEKPLRFFIEKDGNVVINPRILKKEERGWHREGCYSFGLREMSKVSRWKKITVEYRTLKDGLSEIKKEELEDMRAYIFQHEIDHMNGISIYTQRK